MSFFCISGAQDETGKFCFRNTRHTFITKGVGTKAEQLNNNAELHNLQTADTVAFELQTATAARDWSNEPGRETRCGLLSTFARTATGVPELDSGETVWQCNWVRTSEPSEHQKPVRRSLVSTYTSRRYRNCRALHHRESNCETRQCRRCS